MTDPVKKADLRPEDYQPKEMPEIVKMAGEQALQPELDKAHMVNTTSGGAGVPFGYVFSGFRALDFTNCFASLYMYMEDFVGDADTLRAQQERLFFLFDTVSGRSAALRGWGNVPTAIFSEIYDSDGMIDFLMGYTGYTFEKYTDNLTEQIRVSIGKGVPVLARLKKEIAVDRDGYCDSFRLITGYQNSKLRMPEPKGAQSPPKKAPKLNDLDSIYVITGRAARKHTLLDGLRRIQHVMDFDREAGVWDEYIGAFENYWERLRNLPPKELKQRFKDAYKGTTWNCHNFAAPFRTHEYLEPEPEHYQNWIWDELKDPRFGATPTRAGCSEDDPLHLHPKALIDWACDQSHTLQWQFHALYETHDWSKKYYDQMEWGTCETAAMLLHEIKKCDGYVYAAVCEIITILEEESS